jgi:hypothetical protein
VHLLRAEGPSDDPAAQEACADYLLRIGEGHEVTHPSVGDDVIRLDREMCCPTEELSDPLLTRCMGLRPAAWTSVVST